MTDDEITNLIAEVDTISYSPGRRHTLMHELCDALEVVYEKAKRDEWENESERNTAEAERDALRAENRKLIDKLETAMGVSEENDHLRAVLDDIRAEQQDYTIPHDEALSNIGEILSRAIDTKEEPCPYTFSHTREFCGRKGCRES